MMDFNGQKFHSDLLESPVLAAQGLSGGHQNKLVTPPAACGGLDRVLIRASGPSGSATDIPLLMASAPEEFDVLGAS